MHCARQRPRHFSAFPICLTYYYSLPEQHVFADTLRSTAVLIAAGISYTFKVGEPPFVDAVAALAVSIIILLSLGPLLNGILHAAEQLKQLSRLKTRFSPVPV